MRHANPAERSWFEMVPVPIIVPAARSRVFAAWAMSSCNPNCASAPASGLPSCLPFTSHVRRRWMRPSFQRSPSSSGVAATGASAFAPLPFTKPNPFASSAGIRRRNETSFTSVRSRTAAAACTGVAPMGTSPTIATTSPSRSMPQSSESARIGSRGPIMAPAPPWYMSGSL